MYRQVFIPSKKTHTIAIPREWYGQEIELTASPTQQRSAPPCQFTVEEMRERVRLSTAQAEAGQVYTTEELLEVIAKERRRYAV